MTPQLERKINGILTEKQQKQWADMKGKKFTMKARRGGPDGGPQDGPDGGEN